MLHSQDESLTPSKGPRTKIERRVKEIPVTPEQLTTN